MPPPTTYTRELADWICDELKKDRSLADICSAPNMPRPCTVQQWARNDHDGFAARYKAAQRRRGRTTEYTRAIGDHICRELSRGRMVKDVCKDDGMPSPDTVSKWAEENRGGDFGIRYREFRKLGNSHAYPQEVAELICAELEKGRTLRDICRAPSMPDESTVRLWIRHDRNGFAARYKLARETGCDALVDEMKEIADDESGDLMERQKPSGEVELVPNQVKVSRARVRLDHRRWLVSKIAPRRYGDRLEVKATHDVGHSLTEMMKAIDGRTRGLPRDDERHARKTLSDQSS